MNMKIHPSIIRAIKAASTSETSVNFYQTTRRYNPEDNHIHTRRRENLTSYKYEQFKTLGCDSCMIPVRRRSYDTTQHWKGVNQYVHVT
jgi:hypothetical protein